MNLLEFITEEQGKDLYTIINTRDGSVPMENNEPFKTWAVSTEKGKSQIMFRMRKTPDKYAWKVLNNPFDYEAITWDHYKKMEVGLETNSIREPQPIPQQPEQLKLFDDPTTAPY